MHLLLASGDLAERATDGAADVATDAAKTVTQSAVEQFKSMSDLFAVFNLGNLLSVSVRFLVMFIILTILYRITKRVIVTSYSRRSQQLTSSSDARKQLDTFYNLSKSTVFYVFLAMGAVGCLGIFGFDVRSLATSAGIAGAALVLISQDLIKDWVGGVFILVDRQFDVGDYVTIGEYTGEVRQIGIRHTQIATDNAVLVTIPNGDIHTVINYSKEPVIEFYDVRIHDATRLDDGLAALGKAIATINAQYKTMLVEPATIMGVQELVGTAAVLRLRFVSQKDDTYGILRSLRAECLRELTKVDLQMKRNN